MSRRYIEGFDLASALARRQRAAAISALPKYVNAKAGCRRVAIPLSGGIDRAKT
ncbi:MAG: hypothetical protein J6S43_05205 [Lentisphaeria bacterium]|nr:hypothetical protein [Lentisphaeria bacterium]